MVMLSPALEGVPFLVMLACSFVGLCVLAGVKRTAVTLLLVGLGLVPWLWAADPLIPYAWDCGPWWWHLFEPWCLFR